MPAFRMVARLVALVVLIALAGGACAKKQPPIARPTPPPPTEATTPADKPGPPPQPVDTPPIVPSEPTMAVEDLDSRSLDELNRESPFQPVFFGFDSSEIDAAGQAVLTQNADLMRKYPSWVLTIEGHCDERGTAEYNLALGERRALAARNYLVTLGIPADRLRTVSYGKEFPFDPAQSEEAYAKNRRAHFVITSK
jgi:peptidoglycan-associated lipoprotein